MPNAFDVFLFFVACLYIRRACDWLPPADLRDCKW